MWKMKGLARGNVKKNKVRRVKREFMIWDGMYRKVSIRKKV